MSRFYQKMVSFYGYSVTSFFSTSNSCSVRMFSVAKPKQHSEWHLRIFCAPFRWQGGSSESKLTGFSPSLFSRSYQFLIYLITSFSKLLIAVSSYSFKKISFRSPWLTFKGWLEDNMITRRWGVSIIEETHFVEIA